MTTTVQNKCPECQRETTMIIHINGQAMCGICKEHYYPALPVTVFTEEDFKPRTITPSVPHPERPNEMKWPKEPMSDYERGLAEGRRRGLEEAAKIRDARALVYHEQARRSHVSSTKERAYGAEWCAFRIRSRPDDEGTE